MPLPQTAFYLCSDEDKNLFQEEYKEEEEEDEKEEEEKKEEDATQKRIGCVVHSLLDVHLISICIVPCIM